MILNIIFRCQMSQAAVLLLLSQTVSCAMNTHNNATQRAKPAAGTCRVLAKQYMVYEPPFRCLASGRNGTEIGGMSLRRKGRNLQSVGR